MSYRLEFMRGYEMAALYEGDALATPEIAHLVGTTMLEKMREDLGATSFRVIDPEVQVVSTGPVR